MSKNKGGGGGGNKPSGGGGNKPSGGGGGGNKPSGGGGNKPSGGGVKVAGVNVGKAFNAADIAAIQAAKPNISVAAIQQKAKAADVKIKPGATSVFRAEAQKFADAAKEEEKQRTQGILEELGVLPGIEEGATSLPGEEIVPFANFDLAKEGANLEIQRQIASLREAGATERTKYEVDNRIPLVQAESKGKIDLQAIVNAGYKNIANIERGTEMVRNITSMFNF
jgi:hypothetical protein